MHDDTDTTQTKITKAAVKELLKSGEVDAAVALIEDIAVNKKSHTPLRPGFAHTFRPVRRGKP